MPESQSALRNTQSSATGMVVQVGPEYALDENRIKPSVAASLTKPPADQILLALVGKLNEVSNSFTVYANRVKVIQKLYNL